MLGYRLATMMPGGSVEGHARLELGVDPVDAFG
jgi:hypothetical protein